MFDYLTASFLKISYAITITGSSTARPAAVTHATGNRTNKWRQSSLRSTNSSRNRQVETPATQTCIDSSVARSDSTSSRNRCRYAFLIHTASKVLRDGFTSLNWAIFKRYWQEGLRGTGRIQ